MDGFTLVNEKNQGKTMRQNHPRGTEYKEPDDEW